MSRISRSRTGYVVDGWTCTLAPTSQPLIAERMPTQRESRTIDVRRRPWPEFRARLLHTMVSMTQCFSLQPTPTSIHTPRQRNRFLPPYRLRLRLPLLIQTIVISEPLSVARLEVSLQCRSWHLQSPGLFDGGRLTLFSKSLRQCRLLRWNRVHQLGQG